MPAESLTTPLHRCVRSVCEIDAEIFVFQSLVTCQQELKTGVVPLLIPTPNARNECGYNRDHFLLNSALTAEDDLQLFKFLGILVGVAMRTKKPLDLSLAPCVWKQLAGMPLTQDDLEEVRFVLLFQLPLKMVKFVSSLCLQVDLLLYIQNLQGIASIHENGVTEETFHEVRISCALETSLTLIYFVSVSGDSV